MTVKVDFYDKSLNLISSVDDYNQVLLSLPSSVAFFQAYNYLDDNITLNSVCVASFYDSSDMYIGQFRFYSQKALTSSLVLNASRISFSFTPDSSILYPKTDLDDLLLDYASRLSTYVDNYNSVDLTDTNTALNGISSKLDTIGNVASAITSVANLLSDTSVISTALKALSTKDNQGAIIDILTEIFIAKNSGTRYSVFKFRNTSSDYNSTLVAELRKLLISMNYTDETLSDKPSNFSASSYLRPLRALVNNTSDNPSLANINKMSNLKTIADYLNLQTQAIQDKELSVINNIENIPLSEINLDIPYEVKILKKDDDNN